MKQKYGLRRITGAAGICFLLGMGGCSFMGGTAAEYTMSGIGAVQGGTEELPPDEDTEAFVQPDTQAQEEAVEKACQAILDPAAAEFMKGYQADRTFVEWAVQEYGEDCILELAGKIPHAMQDQDIWYALTGNTIHALWLLYCKDTGIEEYRLENVEWKECAAPDITTLAFTGDINFSEGYATTRYLDGCANGILDCFSSNLLEVMNGMDVMMINNEFTYSTRGEPLKGKTYTFRADPSRAKLLHEFGTDIVNLANNHVYDFGPDALLDTISTLDQEKIPHVGAGANIKDASKPYYFICNGRKIAIVAATQIERTTNYTKEATEDAPGVLKALNPDKFVKVIEEAEKNSDCVIAVVHWGTEGDSFYGRDQESLAHAFVEAGADAIIGGHTHCLQGFEVMDGVPVIYSLGNFWFSSKTLDTELAVVTIEKDGALSLSFLPCIQKNFKTSLVTEEAEKERIFTFLQKHSAPGTQLTEDGTVQQVQQVQQ